MWRVLQFFEQENELILGQPDKERALENVGLEHAENDLVLQRLG